MNTKSEYEKKKITYVITRGVIGGAQFHTLDLINEFKNEYEVLLISGSDGVLTEEVKKSNVRVIIIPEVDSLNFLLAASKLYMVLKNEKPNLIHVHSSLASFYGRIAAKLVNVKVIYTVHGWHFSHEPNWLKKIVKVGVEWFLKSFTSFWITVSEFDNQLGSKYRLFKKGQVKTIPNGVKDIRYMTQERAQVSPLPVVFVGRATYQKNCEAAVKVIENTNSDVHLTMYVSGNNTSVLNRLINQSPAKSKITLILNDSDASEKLYRYSVMLVTSRYEGMPLSVLEAMREGLGVVSTDVCGMNEIVKDRVNGFLLPENKEEDMAKMLDWLGSNHEELKNMKEKSRELFEENFTSTKMLKENRQIYEKLL